MSSETVKDIRPTTIPNLTHINWRQPLVSSVRIAISQNRLPAAYPVDHETEAHALYSDEMIKHFTRNQSNLNQIKAVRTVATRQVQHLPVPDKYSDPEVFLEVVRRLKRIHEAIKDKPRSGAIVAVLLIELGWPVHLVISALNTSRPTVNRWVFVNQELELTNSEIEIIADAMFPEDSEFSALFDFRTLNFRLRRSGYAFKKAVFLPHAETVDFMRALWRVAYRTRGDKSKYTEYVCAQTLDVVVELLLRRGVTALNIAKILGVQHMAIIQRHRKAKDIYGSIEETLKLGDEPVTDFDRARLDRVKSYTSVTDYGSAFAARLETSLLLQVRTSAPTKYRTIPAPNVSVLCNKESFRDDFLDQLEDLDTLSGSAAHSVLESLPEPYGVVQAQIADRGLIEDRILSATAKETRYSREFFTSSTLSAALFDAPRLGYAGINYPFDTSETRLTEYMLIQATMQYDRDRFGLGYSEPTFHWIPSSVFDLINIVPEDSAKEMIEELASREPTEGYMTNEYVDTLMTFFPEKLRSYLDTWLEHSQREMAEDAKAAGEDSPENSPLWKSIHCPSEVLAEYPAPVARKMAS